MDSTRPKLAQRVTAVLHAKQYLVFFSIALYALTVWVPLGSAWLHRRSSFPDILRNTWGPLADAVAARSVLIAFVFIVYVLVMTWFRAGYIRSLVGGFHFGPADARQFLRLLGLEVILECTGALGVWGSVRAGADATVTDLVVIALLLVYFAVQYTDYIVIIAGVGPLRAIVLSWRTVRATLLPSVTVFLVVSLLGSLAANLLGDSVTGTLLRAAPMLVVQGVLMGAVVFVADVVLIVLYLDAVERGRLTPGSQMATPAGGGGSGRKGADDSGTKGADDSGRKRADGSGGNGTGGARPR